MHKEDIMKTLTSIIKLFVTVIVYSVVLVALVMLVINLIQIIHKQVV